MAHNPFVSVNIFEHSTSSASFLQTLLPDGPGPGRLSDVGTKCETQCLDSTYNAKGDRITLRSGSQFSFGGDQPPPHQSALVLTRFWTRDGQEDYRELEIRSPHMKAAIKASVPEYAEFDTEKHIILRDEPRCIFHFRDKLFAYGRGLDAGSDAQKHVSYLLEYMRQELRSQLSLWTNMLGPVGDLPQVLDFPSLWMLFPKGEIVVFNHRRPKLTRAFEFESMTRCKCNDKACENKDWDVTAWCIDFDGEVLGYRPVKLRIPFFSSPRSIYELPILPLPASSQSDVGNYLEYRGKLFQRLLRATSPLHYSGIGQRLGDSTKVAMTEDKYSLQGTLIHGRVMIDGKTAYELNPSSRPRFGLRSNTFGTFESLTGEHYMIFHDALAGFALNQKQWCFLDVDLLEEITHDDNLIAVPPTIDPERKAIIKELGCLGLNHPPSSKVDGAEAKGLICLLYGDAGAGMPLAAEKLADEYCRPLFRIDNSVVGATVTALSLERGMTMASYLSKRWHSVGLLDESYNFLVQKHDFDSEKSILASVFFRILQCYEGVLFICTSRPDLLDSRFKSQIDLAIPVPRLTIPARRQLWEDCLKETAVFTWQPQAGQFMTDQFAHEDLDAKQIKTITKLATAGSRLVEGGGFDSLEANYIQAGIHMSLRMKREFDQACLAAAGPSLAK